jgi:hypothetical protein
MIFQHYRQATITIQCAWRQKLARKELRKLRMVFFSCNSVIYLCIIKQFAVSSYAEHDNDLFVLKLGIPK